VSPSAEAQVPLIINCNSTEASHRAHYNLTPSDSQTEMELLRRIERQKAQKAYENNMQTHQY